MYPNHPEFKTFHWGSKTIDYALALPDIADRVSNLVYEPFFYRCNSDYRNFFFDISEKVRFGNRKISPLDPSGRGFSSKDVKNTKVYLEQFHHYLLECNAFNRIERLLQSRFRDHREVERIDINCYRRWNFRRERLPSQTTLLLVHWSSRHQARTFPVVHFAILKKTKPSPILYRRTSQVYFHWDRRRYQFWLLQRKHLTSADCVEENPQQSSRITWWNTHEPRQF